MSDNCPIPNCTNKLGTTRQGDPWAMCRKHWLRVPVDLQYKLWRALRSWQRIERQPKPQAGPLLLAKAIAIQEYIDVRNDCIRKASAGEAQQLEVAN